jgi:hypothetical protein
MTPTPAKPRQRRPWWGVGPFLIIVPVGDVWALFDSEPNIGMAKRICYVCIGKFGDAKMVRPEVKGRALPLKLNLSDKVVFTRREVYRVRDRAVLLPDVGPGTPVPAPGPGWWWDFTPMVRRMAEWKEPGRLTKKGAPSFATQEWNIHGVPYEMRGEYATAARARDISHAELLRRLLELHQMAICHSGSSPDILSLLEEADLLPVIT